MLTVLALACACALPARADTSDIERVRATTTRLINQLVEQGLLTRERAALLLKELEAPPRAGAGPAAPAPSASNAPPAAAPGAAAATAAATPVRVPFVPEFVRQQLKEEIRGELAVQAARDGWAGPNSVPGWVRGLRLEGDLRTRFQQDNFDAGNAPAVSITETNRTRALTLTNTTVDRQRLRVRARLGATVTVDDTWGGGIRLSTGSSTDPLSANQTLGNYGNRYTVTFDRAFIRWRQGQQANAVAGRFGNPWFGTDLVWANDLSFDGVALQWTPDLGRWGRGFVTAAAMPVQEVELAGDKWLYGVQAGLQWPSSARVSGRVALAYYHYSKIKGQANAPASSLLDYTAPAFAQKGNTYFNISSDPARPLLALAADYHLVGLTGSLEVRSFGDKRLVFTADVVKNIGYDEAEVSARLGTRVEAQTMGYLLRASLGDAEVDAAGRWQAFLSYKHLERDAVLDAFTDSDLRGGGTDVKGFTLGGSYGLGRNSSLTLRWLSGDALSGAPLSLDSVQVDLLVRF
ncbi:hypothetical protein D621_14820 [beta proteobacterium AAP51]|nr:hypothetical protein D621_14820 [beta proteobacterium AAP51]